MSRSLRGIARRLGWAGTERASDPGREVAAYPTFAAAIAECGSYENPHVIAVVSAKSRAHVARIRATRRVETRQQVQNLFALEHVASTGPVRVLEIGGACGVTFNELAALRGELIAAWTIVETPAMARAAAEDLDDKRLAYRDDLGAALDSAGPVDVIWIQGALQYLPEPVATLRDLLMHPCRYIYASRLVLASNIDQPVIVAQTSWLSAHGAGTMPAGVADREITVPHSLLPRTTIERLIIDSPFVPAFEFVEEPASDVRVAGREVRTEMIGLLLKRAPA